jgi:rhodanese-related sulfurtransferase
MIKEEELNKKKLNTDNIETTNVNGHEIVSVKDEETDEKILYDNTTSNRDFKEEMQQIQDEHKQFQSKDELIIVYCSNGLRSKRAQKKLERLGYKNVYNLDESV